MQATGGYCGYFFCFCCWYLLKWVWMVMAALSGSVMLLASGIVSPGGQQSITVSPESASSPEQGSGVSPVGSVASPLLRQDSCPCCRAHSVKPQLQRLSGTSPGQEEQGTGGRAKPSLPGSAKPSIYTARLPEGRSFPTFNHHVRCSLTFAHTNKIRRKPGPARQ